MKDILHGGKADNMSDKLFNKRSLKKGMKHESEHTGNKAIQKEIAKDHLAEDPKYYERLDQVEKMAFARGFQKLARCWKGYEPVPGKKAYDKGSCRPMKRKG